MLEGWVWPAKKLCCPAYLLGHELHAPRREKPKMGRFQWGSQPAGGLGTSCAKGREAPGKVPIMKKRILLADDDPGIREMLGRVLESEQYEVALAGTGREAVAKFAAHPPDLILLDLNMPDLDGWEAIDRITRIHPFTSVIVITARPKQYEQAVGMAVDALMEKPLDLPLLLAAIADLVAESEAQRVSRLSDPCFKTRYLKSPADGGSTGAE